MATKHNYGFFGNSIYTSPRGHQKIKRYSRRQLIQLPAHVRLTPEEKKWKLINKRRFYQQKNQENNDK